MVTGDNDADTNSTKESPKPEGSPLRVGTPPKMRLMNRKERRKRDALNRKAIKRKLKGLNKV